MQLPQGIASLRQQPPWAPATSPPPGLGRRPILASSQLRKKKHGFCHFSVSVKSSPSIALLMLREGQAGQGLEASAGLLRHLCCDSESGWDIGGGRGRSLAECVLQAPRTPAAPHHRVLVAPRQGLSPQTQTEMHPDQRTALCCHILGTEVSALYKAQH